MSSLETETEKIYANALNLIPQLGPVRLTKLLNYFSDYQTAWKADPYDYQLAGIEPQTIDLIIPKKLEINPVAAQEELKKHGIEIILISEPEYPSLLKEIPHPPPILYVRGDKQALNKTGLGIVGTRKMTLYGRQAIVEIVPGLVNANLAIVSGLAFGADAEALNACLNSGGIPIAVLASSIDDASISPRTNFMLAQKIIKAGCLVSEYSLGTQVYKTNFPQRNRIISGLSVGTLVVEADLESGSLITANYALEQNREVFSIPGSIFSQVSRGTNNLIKRGAKLVNQYQDILEELNISSIIEEPLTSELEESEAENTLLSYLTREPLHIDDLTRELELSVSEINSALTLLEIKGRVKNLGGNNYIRVR